MLKFSYAISLCLNMMCEKIFINTISPNTMPKLKTKLVSGRILLENNPSLALPRYLNKSKWARGKYLSHTAPTSPFKTKPTIKISDVKNTESVFDLQINDKNMAREIKNIILKARDKK